MKKIGLLLAAAVTVATVSMFAPAASANTDVCAGTGNALVSPGLGLPPAKTNANFSISLTGACLPSGKALTATGSLTGACGQSRGTGITNGGHRFAWTSVGTLLILTGQVTGVVTAFANPLIANNSCAAGNAHNFQVQGAGVKSCHTPAAPTLKQRTTISGPPNVDIWLCIGL